MDKRKIEQLILSTLPIAASKVIPKFDPLRFCNITAERHRATEDLIIMLHTYLCGLESEAISIYKEYPRDWWRAAVPI